MRSPLRGLILAGLLLAVAAPLLVGFVMGPEALGGFLAGATAIAVGMYNFIDPSCMGGIIRGIDEYLETYGFSAVKDIIGLAHRE